MPVNVRKVFNKFYESAQRTIVPGLRYSRSVYEEVLESSVTPGAAWMDLGCGHSILAGQKTREENELVKKAGLVVGLDCDLVSLARHVTIKHRICGVASFLPFRDNTFDLVTSNMVFEHLEEPRAQFAEILRVLKPGGRLVFHTPNKLGYSTILARLTPRRIKARLVYFLQRRSEDDVFPTFYRINKPRIVKTIAEDSGFGIREIRLLVSGGELVMIPALVVLELLWIRILMTRWFKTFRTHLVVSLTKPGARGGAG